MDERRIEISDPFGHLTDETRELFTRIVRLAVAGVPHRIVSRLDFVDGRLGAFVTVERRAFGRWTATRPATWLPLAAHTTAVFAVLLHVGEHGRLPDLTPKPSGESQDG